MTIVIRFFYDFYKNIFSCGTVVKRDKWHSFTASLTWIVILSAQEESEDREWHAAPMYAKVAVAG